MPDLDVRAVNARQDSNDNNDDQERSHRPHEGLVRSADFYTFILNLGNIAKASEGGIPGFSERHVVLQMLLRQQFNVPAQLFLDVALDSLSVKTLEQMTRFH